MNDYTCAKCKSPCSATLWESGAGSDCCEANLCVDAREDEERLREGCPIWDTPPQRELTAAEHRDLTEELAEEQYQEMPPAQQRHWRRMESE